MSLEDSLKLAELERLQFSCELHDGILQYLIGARMAVETLQYRAIALSPQELVQKLVEIEGMLRRGIDEGRDWIGALRGEHRLLNESFEAMVQSLAQLVRETVPHVKLVTDFDPAALRYEFPEPVRIAIYRIAQESLRNATKHSHSDEVIWTLSLEEGKRPWKLQIIDRGRGFLPDKVSGEHHGLEGMRLRASMIHGEFEVDSKPGEGTMVTLSIEVPEKKGSNVKTDGDR